VDEVIPYKKMSLKSKIFRDEPIEIRIYDGDEDPTKMNPKRIGIYLFKNNEFIASEWIECGKVVGNFVVSNPEITTDKKNKMMKRAIDNMKNKLKELENSVIIDLQKEALRK
jgi:hypothetical protein